MPVANSSHPLTLSEWTPQPDQVLSTAALARSDQVWIFSCGRQLGREVLIVSGSQLGLETLDVADAGVDDFKLKMRPTISTRGRM